MRFQQVFVAGLIVLLAGCSSSGVVSTVRQSFSLGGGDDFANEATVKDILVVVRGNAFGVDQKTLQASVIDRMQGAAWGVNAHFTAAPGPNVGTTYSLVLFVGAPDRENALGMCAHPETFQPIANSQNQPIELVGALCRFDKTVTSVTATAGRLQGLEDPSFRTLVASATRDLTFNDQRTRWFKRDD